MLWCGKMNILTLSEVEQRADAFAEYYMPISKRGKHKDAYTKGVEPLDYTYFAKEMGIHLGLYNIESGQANHIEAIQSFPFKASQTKKTDEELGERDVRAFVQVDGRNNKKIVGVNRLLDPKEIPFSIFHEYAHIVLHVPPSALISMYTHRSSKLSAIKKEEEKAKGFKSEYHEEFQANRFSSAVLMNRDLTRKEIAAFETNNVEIKENNKELFNTKLLSHLSNVFGVSEKCVTKRLVEINHTLMV